MRQDFFFFFFKAFVLFRVNSRSAFSNHFQTHKNRGMQYPTAVRRLGAGLLRNPVPQVFLTLRFRLQAGVLGTSAAGGGLEADTGSWGIFHTSTRSPGGCRGAGIVCKQILLPNGSRRFPNSSVRRAGRTFRPPSLALGTANLCWTAAKRAERRPGGGGHAASPRPPTAACRGCAAVPTARAATVRPCQPQQHSSEGRF